MRVLDQCTRLPFREAREALEIQGLPLSLSHCERLTQSYGEVFEAKSVSTLEALASAPQSCGASCELAAGSQEQGQDAPWWSRPTGSM